MVTVIRTAGMEKTFTRRRSRSISDRYQDNPVGLLNDVRYQDNPVGLLNDVAFVSVNIFKRINE